ncbi:hypothetical protein BJX64DRAFT_297060 [Aspergillus heterothallicus]
MDHSGAAPTKNQDLENQHQGILRVASYHRSGFDLAVARVDPADHERVRSSLLKPPPTATEDLGTLQYLPLEILCEICSYLDIASLLAFRHANRRASQVVYTIRQYRVVVQNALNALCVLLRTELANQFSLADLATALYTKYCSICSSFGGFVFLPSLSRCCFSCIHSAPELRVTTLSASLQWLHVITRQPTVMKALPGLYLQAGLERNLRNRLVSIQQVADACPMKGTGKYWASITGHSLHRYMASTALPYVDKATGLVEHGVCCAGCQVGVEFRHTGLIEPLPALEDKVYSHEGFLKHFDECSGAQSLWSQSLGGTVQVKLPVFVIRRGVMRALKPGHEPL